MLLLSLDRILRHGFPLSAATNSLYFQRNNNHIYIRRLPFHSFIAFYYFPSRLGNPKTSIHALLVEFSSGMNNNRSMEMLIIEHYMIHSAMQLWDECLETRLDPDVKGRIIGVQTQMTTFDLLLGLQVSMKILII